jgi:hypothetical protein
MSMRRIHQQISDLTPGQRAWFWFSPSAVTPMHISPLDEDPGMKLLQRVVQRMPSPEGAAPIMGLLSMGEDGRVDLGSPQMDHAVLVAVARMVKENLGEYPRLGLLKDARARVLDARFVVQETIADPSLWKGIPSLTPHGTVATAAKRLSAMAVGEQAWFWATLSGPGGEPFIVASHVETDPGLADLSGEVRLAARRAGKVVKSLQGVICRQADGSLLLRSDIEPRRLQAVIRGLQRSHAEAHPVLSQLTTTACTEGVDDLSAQAAMLEKLALGESVLFWLHTSTQDTTLVLAEDKLALKQAAKETGRRGGHSVRGQLRRSDKGWLEFRANKNFVDFLPTIATWAVPQTRHCPALRMLKGARMTVRDTDGRVTARYRDDAVWASM